MSVPKEYLKKEKTRGILKIKNLKTDKLYLFISEDAIKSYQDERFKLDLGIHENKALQEDYESLGLELFIIEIDVEAKKDENLDNLLMIRKQFYLDNDFILY